jgi:hypothetical protein
MKFLLIKALLGFGDRLEYLSMCLDFAEQNSLRVIVDWSDPTWKEPFEKYFSLRCPTATLADLTDDMTVYPEFWKGKLNVQLTSELYESNRSDIEMNIPKVYPADILVLVSGGTRTLCHQYRMLAERCRLIDDRVISEVRRRQKVYNLEDRWCIHLRGTDRFQTTESKKKRFQELFLKVFIRGLLKQQCVVITDDPHLASFWSARDKSPILSTLIDTKGAALHTLETDNKDEMNVNLLIDFFTMASCKQIFSTTHDSRFARMAENLHPYLSLMF